MSYTYRTETEPHQARRNALLKKYPQVRDLFGNNPMSGVWLLGIFTLQVGVAAFAFQEWGWLGIVLAALSVGAVANHALFVLIHEAAHNLIFKSTAANRWAGIFANLTQGIPSAMAFRTYHLSHHKYQGIMELDADLPGPIEAKIIGNHPVSKGLWLFSFLIIQGFVRPARLTQINLWNGWVVTNLIIQLAFNVAIAVVFGWQALAYLLISTWFAVGLHPLGARWVQEHFIFKEGQETYSYYGSFNKLMFNVGHHNEHHDLMTIPWNHLPTLRKMAPEFYDSLYYHTSYWHLLYQFLMDPKINAFSRAVQQLPSSQPLPSTGVPHPEKPAAPVLG